MQTQQPLDQMISNELEHDPRTTHAVIDVVCVGGQVTLCGAVRTTAEKTAAEQIAKHVAGVVAVDNELEVRPRADHR